MHVVFREAQGLEETEIPMDLRQTPADLVVLSFSDSDLGAFSEGWRKEREGLPSLRLANLVALKHPLSVDTYVDQTLSGAKGILIRLIGGVQYWEYGLNQVYQLAQEKGIALAVLPADGREDTRLDEYSTIPKIYFAKIEKTDRHRWIKSSCRCFGPISNSCRFIRCSNYWRQISTRSRLLVP